MGWERYLALGRRTLALLLLRADAHIVLVRLQRVQELLIRDTELGEQLLLACLGAIRRVLGLVCLRARPGYR